MTRNPSRKQAPGPALALTCQANDDAVVSPVCSQGPACCPTCGRPYFGPASSALLDLVILTHEHLGKIKAALETVVIP
jgi:hypothetical protein